MGISSEISLAPTATAPAAGAPATATATAAEAAAATATGRPLLSERPALRAALCELSSPAPIAHIAKGTAWALGAGDALAAARWSLGGCPAGAAATAHTPGPARTTHTADPASPAGPPHAAEPADIAGSTHATDTASPAGPSRRPHSATRHRHLGTAGQSDRAAGRACEIGRPVARKVCLEPVRLDLPAVDVDVVPTVDVYVGITPAPCGSRPAP